MGSKVCKTVKIRIFIIVLRFLLLKCFIFLTLLLFVMAIWDKYELVLIF